MPSESAQQMHKHREDSHTLVSLQQADHSFSKAVMQYVESSGQEPYELSDKHRQQLSAILREMAKQVAEHKPALPELKESDLKSSCQDFLGRHASLLDFVRSRLPEHLGGVHKIDILRLAPLIKISVLFNIVPRLHVAAHPIEESSHHHHHSGRKQREHMLIAIALILVLSIMLVVFCVRRAAKEPENDYTYGPRSQSALNEDNKEDFKNWKSRLDEWGPNRNLAPSLPSDVPASVLQELLFDPFSGSADGSARSQRSVSETNHSASHRTGRASSNATSPHSGSSSQPTSQSAAASATSQRTSSAAAGHMNVPHELTRENLAVHQRQLRNMDGHKIPTERTPLL